MRFYITKVPPGNAEGSDSWNDYQEHATVDENEIIYGETVTDIDDEFDEDGLVRSLDYFFPREDN